MTDPLYLCLVEVLTAAGELLQCYLDCGHAGDSDTLLTQLLLGYARPVIEPVVAKRLEGCEFSQRREVAGAAMAALQSRLRYWREEPGQAPAIPDFAAYATGVAADTVTRYLASSFYEDNRLRCRLLLLLTTNPDFSVWETAQGAWIAGLASARNRQPASPSRLAAMHQPAAPRSLAELPTLLNGIFQQLRSPVELSGLTSVVAAILHAGGKPSPALPGDDRTVDLRNWLSHLWREIAELPADQRVALLLHINGAEEPALAVLADNGIARFRDLAEAVLVTPRELAGLWNRLPLDDQEIGARLGLEGQQVVERRVAARQNLRRRLSACPCRDRPRLNN